MVHNSVFDERSVLTAEVVIVYRPCVRCVAADRLLVLLERFLGGEDAGHSLGCAGTWRTKKQKDIDFTVKR